MYFDARQNDSINIHLKHARNSAKHSTTLWLYISVLPHLLDSVFFHSFFRKFQTSSNHFSSTLNIQSQKFALIKLERIQRPLFWTQKWWFNTICDFMNSRVLNKRSMFTLQRCLKRIDYVSIFASRRILCRLCVCACVCVI